MPHIPRPTFSRSSHQARTRATHDYDMMVSGLSGDERAAMQDAIDGVTLPGSILPGTLGVASFASTIRPVAIVSALPTLPNPDYPPFSYAVLTTDSRLYKNIADVWVKGVDGADIVADSITAGQIAAGAISTSELAVGARLTGELANQTGATPGVFIDSTGILIRDGKLTLQDEFGQTAMLASGFSGSWSDYFASGLYNGFFAAGVDAALAVGRTATLPYWTFVRNVGSPVCTRRTEITAPGGHNVRFTFAALNNKGRIVSDPVAIDSSRNYYSRVTGLVNVPAGVTVNYTFEATFYDASMFSLSTSASGSSRTSADPTAIDDKAFFEPPPEARYMTLALIAEETIVHNAATFVEFDFAALVPAVDIYDAIADLSVGGDLDVNGAVNFSAGPLTINGSVISVPGSGVIRADSSAWRSRRTNGTDEALSTIRAADSILRLKIDADGKHSWGDGSAVADTTMERSAAGILKANESFSVGGALAVTGARPISAVHVFKGTIAASGATLTLDPVGAAVAGSGIFMPWSGRIVAVSARTAVARSAGSATCTATSAGVNKTTASAVIDGTNPNGLAVAVTVAAGDTFAAGATLRAQVVTVGFTPTANAIQVDVYVVYDAAG